MGYFLMPGIPKRIGIKTLEAFWWDGAFKGSVGATAFWVGLIVSVLLIRWAIGRLLS